MKTSKKSGTTSKVSATCSTTSTSSSSSISTATVRPKAKAPPTMAKYSFAYVRYLDDNKLKIVPLSDIKRFDAETHHTEKTYMIKWTNEDADDSDVEMEGDMGEDDDEPQYFKAQILKLSHSMEALEKCIREGTRVVFRKRRLLDTSVEQTSDEEGVAAVCPAKRTLDFAQVKKKKQAEQQVASRNKEISSIMEKLVANKKPLVLPQAASGTKGKATGTQQAAELGALKTKLKAKTKENVELRERVKKVTELNMRLQNEILDLFAKQSRMTVSGPSTSTPILHSAAPSADSAAP
ncbi:uncharacterized protein LOC129283777 [Lytechinus pictus]|uniref:uncharacterized protein LOC129283777 n=1 Tax=Lytechinus pictus TaxID=7653 RepID=UPI0030BA1E7C